MIIQINNDNKDGGGNRILALDIVRVVALFLVVFFHTNVTHYTLNLPIPVVFNFGDFGVSIFIILSGASLAINSFNNRTITEFYKRRLSSILPYLWVGYFFTTIILFLFGKLAPHSYNWQIVFTLTGLDGYLSSKYYLVGEWFTGFILLMYVASPLIYRCIKWQPLIALVIFAFISFLSMRYIGKLANYSRIFNAVPYFNVTSRVFEFAFGMFLYEYVLKRKVSQYMWVFPSLIFLLVSVYKGVWLNTATFWGILSCTSLTVLFIAACYSLPCLERAEGCLKFMSKYSYMAFIYHHQVVLLILGTLSYTTSMSLTFFVAVSAFTISYCLAYGTYKPALYIRKLVFNF